MNTKLVILLGTIIVVVGGVVAFIALTIINSKGCSQIVIDTNELHSGINIPKVDAINCYYDEQKKVRVSVYRLKSNDYYLKAYIGKFKRVDAAILSSLNELDINEQPTTNTLYEASGVKWGDKWKYVVELETGMLWVEIIYD